MNIHDRRGPRSPGRASLGLSPAQTYALALKWRAEWRAEKTAAPVPPRARPAGGSIAGSGEAKRRAKFAQAIARTEFGRAYWDERLQGGATKAASRPPKPKAGR